MAVHHHHHPEAVQEEEDSLMVASLPVASPEDLSLSPQVVAQLLVPEADSDHR